ncbi:MAG: hypothetical protein KC414_01145, partial [Romboutsia sp.]|nr:hypothetical protein [Romboutsia sp.]
LNKILTELQIPKDQKQIILDKHWEVLNQARVGDPKFFDIREEIITSLLADNSFVVEINTVKEHHTDEGEDSQEHSSLNVPGGTNYKINVFKTPLIVPSIINHFFHKNQIGWFRSDEKTITEKSVNKAAMDAFGLEDENESSILEKIGVSKTRRVLEVQSDWAQNLRLDFNLDGIRHHIETINKKKTYYIGSKEVSSKVYQKAFEDFIERGELIKSGSKEENDFARIILKNWVTFFIESIIQDSAKKGYEKVLFPKGDTAAKIEGHQTLEEFKKQKEGRIKKLEEDKKKGYKILDEPIGNYDYYQDSEGKYIKAHLFENEYLEISKEQYERAIKNHTVDNEINRLKQELADVESGQTQLSSIAKFYEETIHNILKKQGFNPERITDEHGNDWFEIQVPEEVDIDLLPKEEEKPYKEFNKEANDELDALLERTREREEILAQLKALKEEHPEIDGILFNDLSIPGVSFSNQRQLIESIAEEVSRLRYD